MIIFSFFCQHLYHALTETEKYPLDIEKTPVLFNNVLNDL